MPHLVKSRPSPTGPAVAGIGIHSSTSTMAKHSSPLAKEANSAAALVSEEDSGHSDSPYNSDSASEYSEAESSLTTTTTTADKRQHLQKKRPRQDLFSRLPVNVLQQILDRLPPFQMLTISELSRTFYNFVVLGQEMNEVWFRLVKHEEAEEKKRVSWYKQKKLEQEQRSVQMMRSFSGSSTGSNMSSGSYAGEAAIPISKQAQRLLNKKQEAMGKSTSAVKIMKRSDRKKNWCKIYVDTILRGNGEDLLEPLSQLVPGSAKRPAKFQTIVLNEPLPLEHFREFHDSSDDDNVKSKELSREAKTQIKVEKRMYYKSIRSKPKGKKAGQMDSAAAKLDKVSPWRQPEWSQQDAGEY